ncbi:transporter substrate-binding domain-containing protein [Roseovarius pelagicus]|uniref:Transporter substrate-binding domain-containing protein n=1 Tax=Roseovarius pelagicus TaxID=2980108 RepID=A0ABY6DGR9_9RHOB|nr:transporter substrate-binding domain-containing protein [Roseovarius pelagicus]UXX84720.1 transporter substrate-binding domain-containing protein [Roseovarius pelagicus]
MQMFVKWVLAGIVTLLPGWAMALCDVTYRVQPGDTLFTIADLHYGSQDQWTLIYYSNLAVVGGGTQDVPAGADIFIPCPAGSVQPDPTPLRQDSNAEMTLLTGGNYSPFTDRNWPGNGMVTELVNAALEMTPAPVPYAITWEDDWSKHLFPLLNDKVHDMGFPWLRPDCDATPENERCANFHFSAPLMDLPIMLFVAAGSSFNYSGDADVIGRSLCRPAGYFTHDLDRADRRWLSEGHITLVQAESPEVCFEMLMAGEVDAVTLNVFLGATKIVKMGLRGEVVPLDTPLSREALHVIISKKHWRGTTHLYRLNAGLEALRASGRYEEIVARHLEIFEQQLR